MEIQNNIMNDFNFKLNSQEMYKTKMEVDTLNKSLIKDGKEIKKNLGKDEFLKLLITELQHQDPTNPMQDREFIAQMAQFSSLEQMLNLNTNFSKLMTNLSFQNSFDLLGKNVEIDTGIVISEQGMTKIISGNVEAITKAGDDTLVRVNGENYSINNIIKVEK